MRDCLFRPGVGIESAQIRVWFEVSEIETVVSERAKGMALATMVRRRRRRRNAEVKGVRE